MENMLPRKPFTQAPVRRSRIARRQRSVVLLASIFAIAAAVAPSAFAQDKGKAADEKKRVTTPRDKMVTTDDGWQIATTYYPSIRGREASVVILLHMKGGNRLFWDQGGFAKKLQDDGHAVITVDLRKHGQSQSLAGEAAAAGGKNLVPEDYKLMVHDLETVKRFIYDEHQKQNLNMRKMGIVAPEMSATIALDFTLRDWLRPPHPDGPDLASSTPRGQDVRAVALISPIVGLPGMTPTNEDLRQLALPERNIAYAIFYGTADKRDDGASEKLFKKMTIGIKAKDRIYLQGFPKPLRGTDLFTRGVDIDAQLLVFFERHLTKLDGPYDVWRDRQTKLRK